MASPLDRWKRFGTAKPSEKREKYKLRNEQSPADSLRDEVRFPSPSFLRPTYGQMKPRSAREDRSNSLPLLQVHLDRRPSAPSSATSSLTSPRSSSFSRPFSEDTSPQTASDSTYKPSQPRSTTDLPFPQSGPRDGEAPHSPTQPSRAETAADSPMADDRRRPNLLDWSPKHVSMMFRPDELHPDLATVKLAQDRGEAEAIRLAPSPRLSPPASSTVMADGGQSPDSFGRNNSPADTKANGLSLFLRRRAEGLSPAHTMASPPASDSGEDNSTAAQAPSISLRSSRTVPTLRSSQECLRRSDSGKAMPRKASFDRIYGNGGQASPCDDPTTTDMNQDVCSKVRTVRKARTSAALSTVAGDFRKSKILREPSMDDFYALRDDDIAETRPSTPAANSAFPVDTPRIDAPKHAVNLKSNPKAAKARALIPAKPDTPPDTPVDRFFTVPNPTFSSHGTVGAIAAAGLASRYKFDMIYIISIWPSEGGPAADPSKGDSGGEAASRRSVGGSGVQPHGAIVSQPNSGITGRFLAGYGLQEMSSPFQIAKDVHLKALQVGGFKEYRDKHASENGIYRGYMCTFKKSRTETAHSVRGGSGRAVEMNRGIIFAAYVKRKTQARIAIGEKQERDDLRRTLYAEVETLIDVLTNR